MIIFYRTLVFISIALVSYLFGSIPFGVVIGKLFFHKDPRDEGSHNSGGTNTGRVFGIKIGFITIVFDMLKLIIPFITLLILFTHVPSCVEFMSDSDELNIFGKGNTLCELTYYLSAFFAILGHGYSIFLHFKGGKVVSTFMAFQGMTTWITFGVYAPVFFITLKISKHVSLSSIITCIFAIVFSWIIYLVYTLTYSLNISQYLMWFSIGPLCSIYFPIFTTISGIILIFKHKSNIIRLKNHEESSIKWMK